MERRILIHTPRGRDAQVVEQVLVAEKLRSLVCETPEILFDHLTEGAAAVIVTEEALDLLLKSQLTDWLIHQPSWSDLPFIVLAAKQTKRRSAAAYNALQQLGNMFILERPINTETLASAAHAAARARKRQYLAREQLEDIHQAHEQLRLAQMAGGIGVFRIDIETDMVHVSPEFCRLFGFTTTETIPAADIERLVVPHSSSHTISTVESRRHANAELDVEYCIRRADNGALRWIARRAEFVRNAAGKPCWMRGVVLDITERKLAEVTLRESEARFRVLSETMPNHVWTTDAEGLVTWVNRQVCEYTGLSPEKMMGAGWHAVIHSDDLADTANAWENAFTTGIPYEAEFRMRRHDGTYRWQLSRARQIKIDGKTNWLGNNTDIEDHKAMQHQLHELNSTLEQRVAERTRDLDRMWRLSTDLMVITEFDGTIVSVNPAWKTTLGWTEQDLVGTSMFALVHPDERETAQVEAAQLAPGVATRRSERRLKHQDGSYRDISWTAVADDEFIHAVGRDISAEKAAEAALRETEFRLRQSQKMEALGQLTGGIAHDFNNLLQSISGSIDAVRRRLKDSDDVDRFIEAATSSSNRAAALIHRLLAFSRQQSLDNKDVDVNRLVASMEEMLRRTLGPAVALKVKLDKDKKGLVIRSDESQLESAILNLSINARDAMPDGGTLTLRTERIRINATEAAGYEGLSAGDYVLISVNDTGLGMPPDVLSKAFDPFFTTKPIGQGTGLGLSMIYGFAKQSQGHVRLESKVGKGTTVSLYLPCLDTTIQPEEITHTYADMPAGAGETVLVVDDEPTVRMLIIEELEQLGYSTIEAAESSDALPILKSGRKIDLLLSDVGLPGMNGRQVAEIARQHRPQLPVLFMTGYAESALIRSEFLAPGMQMMAKPFPIDELAKRIRDILAH